MSLLFKVGSLTIRTVAKPLSSRFEKFVLGHPTARKSVVGIAQALHRCEVWLTRRYENKTGNYFVGDMTEERAVELAARIVSEGFLWGTAVGLLLLETGRKNAEDRKKAALAAADKARMEAQHLNHVRTEKELQASQMELRDIMARIDQRFSALEEAIGSAKGAEAVKRSWWKIL